MASALPSPLWFARIAAAIVWLGAAAGMSAAGGGDVVVLRATGIVDSVFAGYLAEGIRNAERSDAAAVVIELDTPGGNLESTWEIVQSLEGAKVPTIVWVSPAGARAASAGTFITLAANLAYMAPGTNIGAASPIDSSGNDIGGTLGEKVLNDAVAHMRGIAQLRGRNEEWAVSTVTKAVSTPAAEAVRLNGVNGIAGTLEDVLAAASGAQVSVGSETRTLDLTGATIDEAGMNPFQGFLHLLSDPNIAFILFTIGFYGLLYELIHPNFVTGILGALSIILALVGFGSLPLNVAGLLLVALGIVLLVLEATVTSHGLLTIGGVICFVLGASAFYTNVGDPLEPVVAVATPLLLVTTLTTAAFGALIAFAAIRSRRIGKGTSAVAVPVGSSGIVGSRVAPRGSVYVDKEHWSARSQDGAPIDRGAHVRVVGVEGLTLIVEPEPSSSTGA